MKITDEDIEIAKARTTYSQTPYHDHPDCIRIAYEWLDAQKKIKKPNGRHLPLKHLIEKWANRYVSQSDVEVAAYLHPEVHGSYPFNIGRRLIRPDERRLERIGEAGTQNCRTHDWKLSYDREEME